jgi:hypothetical protein
VGVFAVPPVLMVELQAALHHKDPTVAFQRSPSASIS